MDRYELLALMIWAIDTDAMHLSFERCLEMYQRDAESMQKIYTDPSEPLLFCEDVVGKDPIVFFTDYVLSYAKMHVTSGIKDYGKLNSKILDYQRV